MSRSGIFQVNQILSPPTPPNVPSFPASSSSNSFFHVQKMAERGFDSFVGQDIESVTSWLGVHGLEGLIEIFASKWLILIYLPLEYIAENWSVHH